MLDNFFISAGEFSKMPHNKDDFHQLIADGVQVFMELPDAVSSCLFLMNVDTYEFEYGTVVPAETKQIHLDLFSFLIDKGVIGETLENSKASAIELSEFNNYSDTAVAVPLVSAGSVVGIVNIIFNKSIDKIDLKLFDSISLFTMLFGSVIENCMLFNNLKQAQSLLEQRVALRTIGLAQSKRELQAILDSVQAAILVVDRENNNVISANPMAAVVLDDQQENIVGKNIINFFPEESLQVTQSDKIMFSRNYESEIIKSNGDAIPILRTTSNIKFGDQLLRIESFFDITERKKYELALKDANELLELKVAERTEDLQILVHQLKKEVAERVKAEEEIRKLLTKEQELNELKTRFLSMISHEFRTPLTIISTSTQILDNYRQKLSEFEKQEYFRRILKTVDSMKDLLENVLFIGKSDSNILSFEPTQVLVDDYCKTLIDDFKLSLVKPRQINLIMDTLDSPAVLDPKLLRHILVNLLSNAIKYSHEEKQIDFKVKHSPDEVIFTIKDYGIGIPEDEIDKIFDVFHRARNVGSISGTGLGMSIVLRALELHGGKIELNSKLNEGTTVRIIIPLINYDK